MKQVYMVDTTRRQVLILKYGRSFRALSLDES